MIPLAHDFTGETVLVFGGGSVGARKARRFAREARVVVVSPSFEDGSFDGPAPGDSFDGPAPGGSFDGTAPGDSSDDSAPGDSFDEPTPGGSDRERADAGSGGRTGDVELVRAAPAPGDVAAWIERVDPALVVAATDDAEVNEAAATAARERGLLVNRADRSGGDSHAQDSDRTPRDVAVPATVREDPVVLAISTGGASPALARVLRERLEAELAGAGAMAELTADMRERLRAEGVEPGARRTAVRAVARSPDVWTGLRAADPNVDQIAEGVVEGVLEDR